MKINTKKIQKEMDRVGLSLSQLGKRFTPTKTRQGTWYVIHHAKKITVIEEIAEALDLNPRDLLK